MKFGSDVLDLTTPAVMGVLNVTPDSFSDGGEFNDPESAFIQAVRMVEEGAKIIDVGGESTRPGAVFVPVQQELDRVIPVIEKIATELNVVISIDTSKPEVMAEASSRGAGLINDVNALRADGAIEVAASSNLPVCLMHMRGRPENMQLSPVYEDVVEEVSEFMSQRLDDCHAGGIENHRIILDPGFGFGKSLEHNYLLMNRLDKIGSLGCQLLVGVSRKSMIGGLLNVPVEERMLPSVVLAAMAVERGASILRVHDVAETVQAIRIAEAVMNPQNIVIDE